jgi:AmiR/NasT family two-component response regulator
MVGYRLLPDGGRPSALNVFSDTPGALTDESADTGALLAAFASVALTAAARKDTAEQLRRGLESNREIGKAVGLLMATHDIGATEAFDLLRKASSRTNTKLAEVADQVTRGHQIAAD